jgi:hypothetical protein
MVSTEEIVEMPEPSGDCTKSVGDRFDSNRNSKRESFKPEDETDSPVPNSMIPWPSWGDIENESPDVFTMTGTSRPTFVDGFMHSDRQDGSVLGQVKTPLMKSGSLGNTTMRSPVVSTPDEFVQIQTTGLVSGNYLSFAPGLDPDRRFSGTLGIDFRNFDNTSDIESKLFHAMFEKFAEDGKLVNKLITEFLPIYTRGADSLNFDFESVDVRKSLGNIVKDVFKNYLVEVYVGESRNVESIKYGGPHNPLSKREKLYKSWEELLASFDRERTWDYMKWRSRIANRLEAQHASLEKLDTDFDSDSIVGSGQRLSLKI